MSNFIFLVSHRTDAERLSEYGTVLAFPHYISDEWEGLEGVKIKPAPGPCVLASSIAWTMSKMLFFDPDLSSTIIAVGARISAPLRQIEAKLRKYECFVEHVMSADEAITAVEFDRMNKKLETQFDRLELEDSVHWKGQWRSEKYPRKLANGTMFFALKDSESFPEKYITKAFVTYEGLVRKGTVTAFDIAVEANENSINADAVDPSAMGVKAIHYSGVKRGDNIIDVMYNARHPDDNGHFSLSPSEEEYPEPVKKGKDCCIM